MDPQRALRLSGALFAGGVALHTADHARRGLFVSPEGVVWAGTLLLGLVCIALTLTFTRHALASRAAIAVGFGAAIGVTSSHLLPKWGPASEPLASAGVGAITWIAVAAEILGGILFGLAGLYALRSEQDAGTPAINEWGETS